MKNGLFDKSLPTKFWTASFGISAISYGHCQAGFPFQVGHVAVTALSVKCTLRMRSYLSIIRNIHCNSDSAPSEPRTIKLRACDPHSTATDGIAFLINSVQVLALFEYWKTATPREPANAKN